MLRIGRARTVRLGNRGAMGLGTGAGYVPPQQILLDGYNDGGDATNKIEGAQALTLQGSGISGGDPQSAIRTNSTGPSRVMNALGIVSCFVRVNTPFLSYKVTVSLGRDGTVGTASAMTNPSIGGLNNNDKWIGNLPVGWYPFSMNVTDFAGLDATPGKPSNRFREFATTNQSYSHSTTVEMLSGHSDHRPHVSFTYDDVEDTHRSYLAPLFGQHNKPWTIYTCPNNLGISDNLTVAELNECYHDFGADLGYDSRMDGLCWPKGVLDGLDMAGVLDQFAQIRAWLRANVGGGLPVRGEDHMCYAGSNPEFYPTDFSIYGHEPLRFLASVTNSDGSSTVTFGSALHASVQPGMSVYARGSGGTAPLRTVSSIAGDRLSAVLSGSLGFTGATRATFVDESNPFYYGFGRFQTAMRAWGMLTARGGPDRSEDSGLFIRNGLGDYDMSMPAFSMSGMADANVDAVIAKIIDNARRGKSTVLYGHRADQSIAPGTTINFAPSAHTTLFNAMLAQEAAGNLQISTPRLMHAAAGGRGPNVPSFGA